MRRFLLFGSIVFSSILFILAIFLGTLFIPAVQLALVRYGTGILEERHALRIELESFHLRLSGELDITGLKYQDSDRLSARVDQLQVRFDPLAFRKRRTEISALVLRDTSIEITGETGPADESKPFGLALDRRLSELEQGIIETVDSVTPWSVVVERISLRNTTAPPLPTFDAEAALRLTTDPARLSVSQLEMTTGESRLAGRGTLAFGGGSNWDEQGDDALDRGAVSFQDVEVSARIGSDLLDPTVSLDARLQGTLDEITLETLDVSAEVSEPVLTGRVQGTLTTSAGSAPRLKGEIRQFRLTRDAAEWFASHGLLPADVPVPDWLELSGYFDLTPETIVVDLDVSSNLAHGMPARGTLAAEVDPPGTEHDTYRFSVERATATVTGGPGSEISTSFTMEGTGNSVDAFDLALRVNELTVGDETIRDIALTAARDGDYSHLDLDSAEVRAAFSSTVPLDRIGDQIMNRLRHVFAPDSGATSTRGTVDLDLEITEPLTLLVRFVPDLRELSAATVSFRFDGERNEMYGRARMDHVEYDGIDLEGGQLSLGLSNAEVHYALQARTVRLQEHVFHGPAINGTIGCRDVTAHVRLDDATGRPLTRFGLEARETEEGWIASLTGADPVLALSGGRGIDRVTLSPLRFEASRLDLTRDVPFRERIPVDIGGTLSTVGEISFGQRLEETELSMTLAVDDLLVDQFAIGSLVIDAERDRDGRIEIEGRLRRGVDTLAVAGFYRPHRDLGELTVEVEYLSIDYLASFSPEEITDLTGHLQGRINIRGRPTDPVITGDLIVRNAAFSLPRTGATYTFEDQGISIEQNQVRISGFSIRDHHDAGLVLDGTVEVNGNIPGEAHFDLTLRSDRFTLLDTDRRENPRFFGRLNAGSDLRLRGTVDAPVITGSVGLAEGSNLTLVLPEAGPVGGDADQVVRFEDSTDSGRTGEPAINTLLPGVEVSVAVDVNPETDMVLIVDQRSGDRLNIRGGGDFSLGIDPGGALRLSGQYALTGGRYEFSFFNVARREFPIVPGSTITWTGDPLEAVLDVQAMYTVRTSPAPLLATVGGTSARYTAVGDLPFQVMLAIEGVLTSPDVSFAIDMPPAERGALGGSVYAAVSHLNEQESRRNTQAFSLIVLNQFVADDLSGIDEAAVVTAGARSSASRLLTYQLNALSSRYVPGIDLAFTVDSYEAATETGPDARTELQVELSQRFLDDRLVVRFGSRFDLEGERRAETGWSDLAGDVSAEYALTPDGRYRLRAFREREQQSSLEGYRTVTGLALIFSHDFDRSD